MSSFRGVQEVIENRRLSGSLYTNRGSRYSHKLQTRGRCERIFRTHQDRLVKELHAAGVRDMDSANCYLPDCNEEFKRPARESGSVFAACQDTSVLADILVRAS